MPIMKKMNIINVHFWTYLNKVHAHEIKRNGVYKTVLKETSTVVTDCR